MGCSNMKKPLFILIASNLVMLNADIYLHNPRGSNNRINERSAQRKNANRVFDSQNNNRGGYNVGDRLSTPAENVTEQYQMVYFQSSRLSQQGNKDRGVTLLGVEWTNQHGCGGDEDSNPHKLNCNLVLQYMCQSEGTNGEQMRDGTSTQTQDYKAPSNEESKSDFLKRKKDHVKADRAYQESFEWYDKCNMRERNKGLFTADQNVRNSARNTRQNPNGNRYGYECPEERDYYPYWHPSDWKDIGIFAENKSMCSYYTENSFNVKSKWECVEKRKDGSVKHYSQYNNENDCKSNKGEWLEFYNYLEKAPQFKSESACQSQNKRSSGVRYVWGRALFGYAKECLVALDAPFCQEAPFTRDNHLGNGVDLEPLHMVWKIPYFPSLQTQKCVLRIRYNITTDDYDPYHTNSSQNQNINKGVVSPVQQNPAVDIGAQNVALRLAINTAQFGRVFQDRTHLFLLKSRPNGGAAGNLDDVIIHNLNVRGKRGNIVQVYPAVEYDFFPTNLEMKRKDLVHIQWTGSNTHNNGSPGGDGQTGDEGKGATGTDRSNIVGLGDRNLNFPLDMDHPKSIFNNINSIKWVADESVDARKMKGTDVAVHFASAGYYGCIASSTCGSKSLESNSGLDKLLDNASASFGGMLLQFEKGVYHYMCTRNNNLTNRSQKGSVKVT